MILLDTNALIWWSTAPEKLSKKARQTIDATIKKEQILVSSISVWEIYLLMRKNRVGFLIDTDSWLEKLESLESVKFVPIDNKIASQSVKLDFDNPDPADRIVIVTALQYGATIVTADKKILNYSKVQSIW